MLRLSPREAISRQQWYSLNKAADALEEGYIASALEAYRLVIPNLVDEYGLRWSNIDSDLMTPSRNGLCRLLSGYYTLTQTWQAWNYIVQPVMEHTTLNTLPLSERSKLIAARGWATVRRRPLRQIVQEQEEALAMCQGRGEMQREAAHHHLMLCHAYTLAFQEEKSFTHGHTAQQLFSDIGSVWGIMRSDEIMGTAYYTAWKYDEALACYFALEQRIVQIGDEAASMHPYYAQGWAYLGQKDYPEALRCFQAGQVQKTHVGLLYDAARCMYAEGYTRFRQGDYDGALTCHQVALKTFCDDDHHTLNLHNFGQGSRSIPMMATCLHNLALVYEYQRDYRRAFEEERRAVAWQRQLDDPGQMADFLRRATYLSVRCRRLHRTLGYLMEYIRLRSRYRVPGFRP